MIKKISLLLVFVTGACWLAFAQDDSLQQSMKRGKKLYTASCASCHMQTGEGVTGSFPPLANTAYLQDQQRAISIVLKGLDGDIIVNGKNYNGSMAELDYLKNGEIADVLNYVSNSWKNKNALIKPSQVEAER